MSIIIAPYQHSSTLDVYSLTSPVVLKLVAAAAAVVVAAAA